MRIPLAALALAGVLLLLAPPLASAEQPKAEGRIRVAQMARDVTDSVRRQREQRRRERNGCQGKGRCDER